MARILSVNATQCTGCGTCELVCSLHHTGEFNPARSRIQVLSLEADFAQMPVICVQCYRPPCAEICPTEAITREEETGIVRVNARLCTGCRMCEDACPFGVIVFSEAEQKAVKCELCDGDPQCVLFCPTGALQFREAGEASADKRRTVAEKLQETYKSTSGDG